MVTHIFGGPTREILSASLSLQNHPKTQGRRQLTIVRLSFFFFGCSFFLALVFFFCGICASFSSIFDVVPLLFSTKISRICFSDSARRFYRLKA